MDRRIMCSFEAVNVLMAGGEPCLAGTLAQATVPQCGSAPLDLAVGQHRSTWRAPTGLLTDRGASVVDAPASSGDEAYDHRRPRT